MSIWDHPILRNETKESITTLKRNVSFGRWFLLVGGIMYGISYAWDDWWRPRPFAVMALMVVVYAAGAVGFLFCAAYAITRGIKKGMM
jgi:hypothetical protein